MTIPQITCNQWYYNISKPKKEIIFVTPIPYEYFSRDEIASLGFDTPSATQPKARNDKKFAG